MPVYRGRRFLAEAIESLNAQTVDDWTLTVVDDACPDATGELARALAPDANVIRLASQGGAAAARAAGIATGTAPLVALLDQDDLWHPEKLALQIEALRTRPTAGACHTDGLVVDEVGAPLWSPDTNERRQRDWDHEPVRDTLRAQFEGNLVLHASALIRREVWDEVGGQPDPYGGEDWGFWIRVLGRGHRLAHLAEPLYLWRKHDGNTSNDERRDAGRRRARRRLAIRYARQLSPREVARYVVRG